ncbi:MAG: TetR/AcrR family transcriptional regulator [Frankia sp.]
MARATAPHPPARELRSDASRNQQALIRAPTAAVHREGLQVPVGTIAADAGVGVATLYRHFPTREDLLRRGSSRWTSSPSARCSPSPVPPDPNGTPPATACSRPTCRASAPARDRAAEDSAGVYLKRCFGPAPRVQNRAWQNNAPDHRLSEFSPCV